MAEAGASHSLFVGAVHLDAPDPGPLLNRLRGLFRRSRPSSAEVDRILDKISRQGIGDLTDHERELLKRASRNP